MSENRPKPIKVFGRSHYACTRCKISKIKCSGERPACSNCKTVNRGSECIYPTKDRKVVVMESDLNRLYARVNQVEMLLKQDKKATSSISNSIDGLKHSSESAIQKRAPLTGVLSYQEANSFGENFLIPDYQNEKFPSGHYDYMQYQMPPQQYTLSLIDTVYRTYSSEFYLLDLPVLLNIVDTCYRFYADLETARRQNSPTLPQPPSQVSLCYLFIIMAFGEQLLNIVRPPTNVPPNDIAHTVPGMRNYLLASSLFPLNHEIVDLQFIQSALLLALYLANLNRYNTVYNYFAVAVRSAIANGYHRQQERPAELDPEEYKVYRIREEKTKLLWWTVFVIDVGWAAKMNMPVHLDYTDTDVDLPCENTFDIGDPFDRVILENNVHLAKYVAKYIRLIYGPNIRTFSLNYINTDKFNQSLLIKNITGCLNELLTNFEELILEQYRNANLIQKAGRVVANLFLRYHQLLILITRPLLSLVFNSQSSSIIENPKQVETAISKGIEAASATTELLLRLYEYNRLFLLGFFDSQHLFSAILIHIMAAFTGRRFELLDAGIALLKFMASQGNVNAQNCMNKLFVVNQILTKIDEVDFELNLEAQIQDYVTVKEINTFSDLPYYNSFSSSVSRCYQKEGGKGFIEMNLFDAEGELANPSMKNLSENTQELICDVISKIQAWDNFRGLPISIYGTERTRKYLRKQ